MFHLAAKQGLGEAQVGLAYLYVTGFGTNKDLQNAEGDCLGHG